jgi:exodeoxyribonuclease VII small subunit
MAEKDVPKFEDELEDLETVVTQIDSGDLSLEESIGAFERGVALVRSLNQKLDEADRRIEVLTRDAAGDLRAAPYDHDPGPGGIDDDTGDDDLPE